MSIQPDDIGKPAVCPTCNRSGVIDDVTTDSRIIIRHNAILWCVIAPQNAGLVRLASPPAEAAHE